MEVSQLSLGIVVALVLVALAFDFMNGFHDAANSIATVVSTRVLKPYQAVILAAFFNFLAVFIFHLSVANTVGKGIIDQGIVDHYVVFGALIGAIAWNLITWWYGIPSSSSHALIGGIVGAGVAKAGTWALIPAGILKTVAFIFLSPFIGMVLGAMLLLAISWIFRRVTPSRVDRLFRRLQLVSSSMYSLGHGGNDAQKTIGIIWMLLIAAGLHRRQRFGARVGGDRVLHHHRLGTMFGGWRIVKTMGQRITKIRPVGGFCAELSGSAALFLATAFGIPSRPRIRSLAPSSASAPRRTSPRCAGASRATCCGPGS
jgi:PiT family inorganic phosphate transporter